MSAILAPWETEAERLSQKDGKFEHNLEQFRNIMRPRPKIKNKKGW